MKLPSLITKILLGLSIVAFLALGFLGYLQPINDFLDSDVLSFNIGEMRFSAYLMMKTVFTIVILFWVTGVFSEFGKKRIRDIKNIKSGNKALLSKIFEIFIYFFGFVIGLDILGVNLTSLAIFSGAVGIGIGFGLQKITSNFISGLILLFEKSVENDDLVELENGTVGFIRNTGARYTLLEAFDGREIMIPNEYFIGNRVTNWTFSNSKARIEMTIGISYESDIEKAMELILEAAREHPRCIKEPGASCYLREFADSSVNFLLFFWVEDVTEGRSRAKSDVLMSIWKKFKEHDIEIPYPQTDLYIKNAEAFK